MNKLICLLALLASLASSLSATDYYKLTNVKRLDHNLYSADGGLLIETQMCLHLTIGEEAVLQWGGFDGKIIWTEDGDESCDVKQVLRSR